jgi:GAF domain-containing protein
VQGSHEVVEASDADTREIELLQATHAEGPCLDAIVTYRPSLEPDLASDRALERWPKFARAALGHGIAAAYAFPVINGGVAIGALDIYSTVQGDLDDDHVADAIILADLAALAIDRHAAGSAIEGSDISAEAAEPWAHPAVVHNASGMVSAQLDIDTDEALLRLRASAFVMGIAVADLARDIVARKIRLESWADRD